MDRIRVSVLVIGLAGTMLLAACGGVDRDGSVDNFVKELASTGVDVDPDCVLGVLDQYDDDELNDLGDADLQGQIEAACADRGATRKSGKSGG